MDDVDCLFDDLRCTVVDHRIWIGDARNFDTLPHREINLAATIDTLANERSKKCIKKMESLIV